MAICAAVIQLLVGASCEVVGELFVSRIPSMNARKL
jgi:hypothetical protein